MKTLVIFILVLLVVVGGVGYYQGWFGINRENGGLKVKMDPEKFKEDRIKFSKTVSAEAQAMKEKLAKLWKKSEGLSGEEKTRAEKELHDLQAEHDKLVSQIKELDEAHDDKFEDIKKDLEKRRDELEKKMDTLTKKLERGKDK